MGIHLPGRLGRLRRDQIFDKDIFKAIIPMSNHLKTKSPIERSETNVSSIAALMFGVLFVVILILAQTYGI